MAGYRIAILGGGNMGKAIARAIAENQDTIVIAPSHVVIAEPDAGKHAGLSECGGCAIVSTSREAMSGLAPDGVVIIAVKPQMFTSLAAEVGGASEPKGVGTRLVISIMAGVAAARVHEAIGGRIVRVMPNLPVTVGQGMTAICDGPGATREDIDFVRSLFFRMGMYIDIPESLMDAVTAVASSGPAYVFYLAEAMTKGAIEVGFDPGTARQLVTQAIWGAASMLLWEPGEELRQQVTSKGGTTQAATNVFDQAGVMEAVTRAEGPREDRGRELSES